MSRKVTIFLIFLCLYSSFLHSNENHFNPFKDNQATLRDYVVATGEMLFINFGVYEINNLYLSEKPVNVSFEIFKQNLTSPWIFDYSGFKRNQLYHPYFGALYFTSGRSNNLNFADSFLLSVAGSFLWETYFEGPVSSLNDFITTPTAGAITGEMLHRLSFSFYDNAPLLSWILSPMDAFNQLLQNKRAVSPKGDIYSLSFSTLGGLSYTNNTYLSKTVPQFGGALNLVYNEPFGHNTKELYDQFSIDLLYSFWNKSNFLKLYLDGSLFSKRVYFENESLSSIAISFDYDVLYGSSLSLSTSSIGLSLKQAFENKNYSIQSDFIFLGTSDIFYLINDETKNYTKPQTQAPYTYKYGPEVKLAFNFYDEKIGNVLFSCNSHFLFTYQNSTKDQSLYSNLFTLCTDLSYEHKIYKNFYAGLRNILILKNEFFENKTNNEINNNTSLYIKYLCN